MRVPQPIPKVEAWIHDRPEEMQKSIIRFRSIIFQTLPQVEEGFKWNIPIYIHVRNLVYLNESQDGLVIGFMNGAEMSDPANIFEAKDRSMVRHLVFPATTSGPWEELPFYLQESAILNESNQKNSRNKINP